MVEEMGKREGVPHGPRMLDYVVCWGVIWRGVGEVGEEQVDKRRERECEVREDCVRK